MRPRKSETTTALYSRIDPELKEALEALAARQDRPVRWVLEQIIRERLSKECVPVEVQ